MSQSRLIGFSTPSARSTFTNFPLNLALRPHCPVHPLLKKPVSRCKPYVLHMKLTEDPVERRLRQELAADGINFDELLDAGKVLSLTRKLDVILEQCSSLPSDSPQYQQAQKDITKIQARLTREKRLVMQRWLKQLFLAQALLFIFVGGVLSTNSIPHYSVPLVGQALGFWMTWLFSIPALRARKGIENWEKSALNLAFVATPLLNLTLPLLTKNCATIWTADVALLLSSYLFYAASKTRSGSSVDRSEKSEEEQGRVKGILKFLDWGSWR